MTVPTPTRMRNPAHPVHVLRDLWLEDSPTANFWMRLQAAYDLAQERLRRERGLPVARASAAKPVAAAS